MEENGKERKAQRGEESVCPLTVLKGRDEFCMVLGSQPMPFSFYNRIHESHFSMPVVNDNEIARNTSEGLEGKSGFICLERHIRSCYCRRVLNFWLPLRTGRNKMALAGHPRPCETRIRGCPGAALSFLVPV